MKVTDGGHLKIRPLATSLVLRISDTLPNKWWDFWASGVTLMHRDKEMNASNEYCGNPVINRKFWCDGSTWWWSPVSKQLRLLRTFWLDYTPNSCRQKPSSCVVHLYLQQLPELNSTPTIKQPLSAEGNVKLNRCVQRPVGGLLS